MDWALAITTSPRQPSFLAGTVRSLRDAGWVDEAVAICAEPDSALAMDDGVYYCHHQHRLGAWKNWRYALHHLLSHTPAQMLAILQDDLQLRRNLRRAMDAAIRRYGPAAYSPYLSRKDSDNLQPRSRQGWQECLAGYQLCGACFIALPRSLAERLSAELPAEVPRNQHIDAVVADFLRKNGIPWLTHRPSLVEHLADTHSTLGYAGNPYTRRADHFHEQDFMEGEDTA